MLYFQKKEVLVQASLSWPDISPFIACLQYYSTYGAGAYAVANDKHLTQIVWSREARETLAMPMYAIAADDIVDLFLQYRVSYC